MLKVLLLRQMSRVTKAHRFVFLVFALFWCSAKETYPQDAHQQLQVGYPSPPEHTKSYPFVSWDGKRHELAAKASASTFSILWISKQVLSDVFGKTQAGWSRIRGTMDRCLSWNWIGCESSAELSMASGRSVKSAPISCGERW